MQRPSTLESMAVIRVVGIGGGGSNAVNRMIAEGVSGVDFVVINTDNQSLLMSDAPVRVRIGDKLTRGLGAGGVAERGEKAASEISSQGPPEVDRSLVNSQVKRLQNMIGKRGKYRVIELKRKLQKTMWEKVGPAREEKKLKEGFETFLSIENKLQDVAEQ